MRDLTPTELKQHLAAVDEPPLLLDVREPWEFGVCNISGSQLLPMGQIPMALRDLDPARQTVVICHHGVRSFQVARYLEHAGFKDVINLRGGVDAWAKEVDNTMAKY